MFFSSYGLFRILAFTIMPILCLHCISSTSFSQNEKSASTAQEFTNTNQTTNLTTNDGSQPILFEVTSKSKEDRGQNQSSFRAQISWTPNAIGSENTFGIKFLNSSSGEELQNIAYDVMMFNEGNHLSETHRLNQQAASQKYIFAEPGFYTLRIDNIGNTSSSIDLPIHVVPEFSSGASTMILVAGLLCFVLFIARFKTARGRFFGAVK
ncbi:MAG: hypothetical protein M3297_02610 [Thermoproteota archaeon]|nr:hypothetical protein [Thermoproteota archaeon]